LFHSTRSTVELYPQNRAIGKSPRARRQVDPRDRAGIGSLSHEYMEREPRGPARQTRRPANATTAFAPVTFAFVRIIAGEFKGRTLIAPKSDTTRPITDRAKQSIFDVLSPLIEGSIVFDCFCGTGSMGLECLSRGASRAYFFDADRSALEGLRKNIDAVRVKDRSKVIAGDIFRLIRSVPDKAGLIFLDPPYRFLVERPEPLSVLSATLAQTHATPDTTLIFRHDTKDQLVLPEWTRYDVRTYGSMTIELMKMAEQPMMNAD